MSSGRARSRSIALLIPPFSSSMVRAVMRPALSFFTFFHTHSSGLSSGEYGGRKKSVSRPSVDFANSVAFAGRCTGAPSTMRMILPGCRGEVVEVFDEFVCVHASFNEGEMIEVRPTAPHVVPAW